jgi:hypothetical protein
MALSTASMIAIVVAGLGALAWIIGLVIYEVYLAQRRSIPWYVYLLMIGGLAVGLVGGIWLAFTLRSNTGKGASVVAH